MPKISVIVPVYGVEKYIERCARSLFEQTLDDIEFIFVDDCTKDNSIKILEDVVKDYPQRASQVTLLHHESNKGLPQARKTGVEASHGDYIVHCDSDDWVEKNMYKALYESALSEDADMVVCDYILTDGYDYNKCVKGCYNANINNFIIDSLFQRARWVLWNKLFRREVYQTNISYPKGNMGEDMALCSQLLLNCNTIAYVDKPFYYYFKNIESISHKLTTETILRNFNAIKDNTDIVLRVYSHINNRKIKSGLFFLQYNVKAHLFPIIHRKEYRKMFLATYPELFREMLLCSDIPCECKMKYILALIGLYPRKIE